MMMTNRNVVVILISVLGLIPACVDSATAATDSEKKKPQHDEAAFQALLKSHEELLKHSDNELVQVVGPTYFPKPTIACEQQPDPCVPFLKPVLGHHRPEQDVVITYASEYQLVNYIVFIESLRRTGFEGDIVLSVTQNDLKKSDIYDYLSQTPNVVVYAPENVCFNFEGEIVDSAKGGSRTCQVNQLYGKHDSKDGKTTLVPIPDPRTSRTMAIIRYEIYWLVLLNYHPNSWVLVVDARDTYFQSNPFTDVPRNTDPTNQSGLLYYFGENIEATRLGLSPQNSKWIQSAYGDVVERALKEKPTICSGATMGEQVAMESYVRAIVAESDETGTVLVGADQGFHNFIYYSHKLKNSKRIHDIVVFDQGTGIVNNMGAMRTKPLEEWGNGRIIEEIKDDKDPQKVIGYRVLNWDGIVSPVVHQFDRHGQLYKYFLKQKGKEFVNEWSQRHVQNNKDNKIQRGAAGA